MKQVLKPIVVDVADRSTWPDRMQRHIVAAVCGFSLRELYRRIASGRFPKPDDGRTWHKPVIERYVDGGVREFEKRAQRSELRMVSR